MKRIGFVLVLGYCSLLLQQSNAQSALTGVQILRTARGIYDQGRLHELPTLLEQAFRDNKFVTQNEQVEAYRLLVLTYIYLEEPAKADENMISLLNADYFFEPNKESDPVEFQTLFKKFRSKPLFRLSVKFGVNQTYASAIENEYSQLDSKGNGKYTANIGLNGAIAFEKDLKGKFFEPFVINPELMFNSQSFTYVNDGIYVEEAPPINDQGETGFENAGATHRLTHTRFQLNVLLHYNLGDGYKSIQTKFLPYVTLGASAGYLAKANFDGVLVFENGKQNTGTVDNTETYKSLNFSVIAGAGVKYKIGGIYLTGDIRYAYGIGSIVDPAMRKANTPVNSIIMNDYQYINNNFSVNQALIMVGIAYPWFSPKKLIK